MDSKFKVDLFIAGGQKCGTTSIKEYLRGHPQICSHSQTEMTFFSLQQEHEKGISWCIKNYFPDYLGNKLVVAKHATFTRDIRNVQKLYEHNPNCKILFLVRDPIDRAYSSYLMEFEGGSIEIGFDEVVDIALNSKNEDSLAWYKSVILDLGNYNDHINQILKIFSKDQIQVYSIDRLKSDQEGILKDITQWTDLGDFKKSDFGVYNQGGNRSKKLINLIKRNPRLKYAVKEILTSSQISTIESVLLRWGKSKESIQANTTLYISDDTIESLSKYFRNQMNLLNKNWGISFNRWV